MANRKKNTSPAQKIAALARDGAIEELIEKEVETKIVQEQHKIIADVSVAVSEEVSDLIKSHVDDSIQLVLEAIENIPQPEPPKNYFNFWVGLSIGGTLFIGFVAGLLVRGLL